MIEKTLYQQLAGAIGAGDSKLIPRIFEVLADEGEAKVLLAADPPATVEELSEKSGVPEGRVRKMIPILFQKGLIFKSSKKEPSRYYRVQRLGQMHDSTAAALDASRELLDLWKEVMATEWLEYTRRREASLAQPVIRVLPVSETIELGTQILAFEDVKRIVENVRNLAVTRCSCRVIDGRCGKPIDVCIQVNRAADYAVERGTGRKISKEEAIQILKRCEEEGLVHVADNRQEVGHVICNCCEDCCMNWPSLKAGSRKWVVPSRFEARVDADLCTSCEACLERCYFDALHMEGKDGTALVDPGKCMGCGLCAVTCPAEALHLKEVRSGDSIPT